MLLSNQLAFKRLATFPIISIMIDKEYVVFKKPQDLPKTSVFLDTEVVSLFDYFLNFTERVVPPTFHVTT